MCFGIFETTSVQNGFFFRPHCTEKLKRGWWEIMFALTPKWCNELRDEYFTAGWTLHPGVLFIAAVTPARRSSSDRYTEQNAECLNQKESDTMTLWQKDKTVLPSAVFCNVLSVLYANPTLIWQISKLNNPGNDNNNCDEISAILWDIHAPQMTNPNDFGF